MSIAFLTCMENNHTAPQALLLAESIRDFAGTEATAPIYAFSAREGMSVDASLRARCGSLQIEYIDRVLNTGASRSPQANKVFVCQWAEQNLSEDVLVYLDSDSVILNKPERLVTFAQEAALCPAWLPGIASSGPDDAADLIWSEASKACAAVLGAVSVRSLITRKEMRPYFNTGLIAVRRSCGLLSTWLDCYNTLRTCSRVTSYLNVHNASSIYFNPLFFLDQLAFGIAVAKNKIDFDVLGWEYNFPLHYRNILSSPSFQFDLSDLIHIHYLYYLNWPPFLHSIDPPLDQNTQQFRFLKQRTPLLPIQDVVWPPTFIHDFETQMNKWRLSLPTASNL
jgi:hypothetical protein